MEAEAVASKAARVKAEKAAARRETIRKARAKLIEVKRTVVDPETGLKERKSFYGHTREEALADYKAWLNPTDAPGAGEFSVERLLLVAPAGCFARAFAEMYWPLKRGGPKTTVKDLNYTARHLLSTEVPGMGPFGWIPVSRITVTVVAMALGEIKKRKTLRNPTAKDRRRNPEKWARISPRTVNKCRGMAVDVMQLAHAADQRGVPFVDGKWIPVEAIPATVVDVYSPGQLRRLVEAARDRTCFVPAILYGLLGVRLREGLGAPVSALSPAGVLSIVTQQDDEDPLELRESLKTDASVRHLPLPQGMLEELRAFAFAPADARLARGKDAKRAGKRVYGKPLYPSNLQGSFDRAMRRAGLHRLHHHALRHSFYTWLTRSGCPTHVRKALMGHAKTTVDDRYSHASPDELREWLARLWDEGQAEWDAYVEARAAQGLPPFDPVPKGGTKTPCRGAANGRARLSPDDIPVILTRLEGETAAQVARDYPVGEHMIRKIGRGEGWAAETGVHLMVS